MNLKHVAAAVALTVGMAFNAEAQNYQAANDSRHLPEPDMSLCLSPVFMEAATYDAVIRGLNREAEKSGQDYTVEAFTVGPQTDPRHTDEGYTFMRIETATTVGYLMINNAEQKGCVIDADTYDDYKKDFINRARDKVRDSTKSRQAPSP